MQRGWESSKAASGNKAHPWNVMCVTGVTHRAGIMHVSVVTCIANVTQGSGTMLVAGATCIAGITGSVPCV